MFGGLVCNLQVSNWFINARVRLWKPMVEEMYQQEAKEREEGEEEQTENAAAAQTPTRPRDDNSSSGGGGGGGNIKGITATTTTTTTTIPSPAAAAAAAGGGGRRSEFIATENDPSNNYGINYSSSSSRPHHHQYALGNQSLITPDTASPRWEPALHGWGVVVDGGGDVRLGAAAQSTGDVSLTLGLRHSENVPRNTRLSIRDFGGF